MKTRWTPWSQSPEHRALLTSGTYYCSDHSESGGGVTDGGQEM